MKLQIKCRLQLSEARRIDSLQQSLEATRLTSKATMSSPRDSVQAIAS